MRKKGIALVLSGGGARGLAHIGVIEELCQQGYPITSITGTSMGALVGGLHAMGQLEEFKEWVLKLSKYGVMRLLDFSWGSRTGGFIKGEKLLRTIKTFIPPQDIEALPIPFRCVATDLNGQRAVVLDKGSIYEAIHASIAIPGIIKPVIHGNQLLVDGGVFNNIPTRYAIKTSRRQKIVAVNVNAFVPMKGGPDKDRKNRHNAFHISNRVISLMMERIGEFNLKEYPADFMINISRYSCELYEFYRAKEQIEYGRQCAREQLQYWR